VKKPNMKAKHIKKNILPTLFLKFILLFSISFSIALSASAQTKFHKAEESAITVLGTSTFKDWALTSSQMNSEAEFELDKTGNPEHLQSLAFRLEVKSLKSGTRGLDNNAHDALKFDKHPFISFRSISSTILEDKDGNYIVSVKGTLTIAGVSKEKNIDTVCVRNSNGSLSCTKEVKLLMTDFEVTPPVFMMGAMKTGDEITISYTMNYNR